MLGIELAGARQKMHFKGFRDASPFAAGKVVDKVRQIAKKMVESEGTSVDTYRSSWKIKQNLSPDMIY